MARSAPLYLRDRMKAIIAFGAAMAGAQTLKNLQTPGKAATNFGPLGGARRSFNGVARAKRQAIKRRNVQRHKAHMQRRGHHG